MFIDAYFEVATHLVEQYELQIPLHLFLKEFFKNNKKYGSRDRKIISELVYGFYRLGKQSDTILLKDKMILGAFLSGKLPILFFEKTNKALSFYYNDSLEQKMQLVAKNYAVVFQIPYALSTTITENEYWQYLFSPSNVFIRIRKNPDEIATLLKKAGVSYKKINETCLSFEPNVKLDEILDDKSSYVIQDYASQQTGTFFAPNTNEKWWDCCAASGGKSLLLLDKYKNIQLTVSDIRESILQNLKHRFTLYYPALNYDYFVADVSDKSCLKTKQYDAIICDAPCSGAGTWSRSPEQFYFFNEEKLNEFQQKQIAILANCIDFVKPTGKIFYITCSVFLHENEEVINTIVNQFPVKVIQQKLIKGIELGADNLFITELEKI